MGVLPLLTLEETARVAGHARWVEERLFEVLGSWVQAEPDAGAKLVWAAESRAHGEHAAGWRAHQPRVAHLDIDAVVVPSGTGAVAVVDLLAAVDGTVLRLAGVDAVEAHLVAAYRQWVARARPLADGPTVRWATAVAAADEAARRGVAAMLTDRLAGVGPGEVLGLLQVELGALLERSGGLLGLPEHQTV